MDVTFREYVYTPDKAYFFENDSGFYVGEEAINYVKAKVKEHSDSFSEVEKIQVSGLLEMEELKLKLSHNKVVVEDYREVLVSIMKKVFDKGGVAVLDETKVLTEFYHWLNEYYRI